jgi:hypothetical protein
VKKWEYKSATFNPHFYRGQSMAEMGLDGWELVAVVRLPDAAELLYTFKREVVA